MASSHDITPMRHAVRASSPHGMPHSVGSREYTPAIMAALRPPSYALCSRLIISAHTVRRDGAAKLCGENVKGSQSCYLTV
ncbi:hypothetical protein D9P95_24185 [Salmonella enterica subsp. enterica serovar Sandiego]|nr:hypothetical protein [Salmonella enterica subsp. enterica serovar Montevideo]EAR2444897.1 hypothetical protein [Salmonella enterica]EBZ3099541.1 hypothetical protein [Salmonella enterica subsp. enterica serovar Sandiego]EBZ4656151.1 hypothetical protein [Salmonella enterica subsp. enterica serovar Sandiego]MFL82806.1 hypothetical protein [Salmonella enterica]